MTLGAEIGEVRGVHRIVLSHQFHHKPAIESLPGSLWYSEQRFWHLPLSWISCLALRTTFGDELQIGPELWSWAAYERATRVEPANHLREVVELSDDNNVANSYVTQAVALQDEIGLYPHQAAGGAYMATAGSSLIGDETGTGKTAQQITALRILYREGHDVFPALVVTPNSVKRSWVREFEQWWPGLEIQLITGTAAQRRRQLRESAHVYVMHHELLTKHSRLAPYGSMALARCPACGGNDEDVTEPKCEVHHRELNDFVFRTVIADEVHRFKSGKAKWTRALWYVSANSTYRWGLTGTPIQDTIEDLWAVMRFIAPDDYSGKTAFLDRYAEQGRNLWGAMTVLGIRESMQAEFDNGFHPRFRRMLKKIVLPFLPPIVHETRFVEMGQVQRKAYKQMLKTTIAELKSGDLVAYTSLSKATRLVQFASSYADLEIEEKEDGTRKEHIKLSLPSNKISAFLEDYEAGDFGTSSIVVAAKSRQIIELLSSELTRKKIEHGLVTGRISETERQRHIDEFQAGKTQLLLLTIDAGGTGLTLTAANVMVRLQRSWSSIAMTQVESRVHRIGSEIHESVLIVDYVSENTVEEKQILAIQGKYARIEAIIRDQELLARWLADEEIPDEDIPEMAPLGVDDEGGEG